MGVSNPAQRLVPTATAALLLGCLAACGGDDDGLASDAVGTGGTLATADDSGTTASPGTTTTTGAGASADSGSTTAEIESADETGPGSTTTGGPAPYYGPARYPADRVHSPITPFVADRIRTLQGEAAAARDDVFLKAGASSTASAQTLFCFANERATDLGRYDDLGPALAFFRGGDAAGTTAFARVSLAAETGRSASWVIDGSPSPLTQEFDAISPGLALVHYGTNDMNLGITHGTAIFPFFDAMLELTDSLVAQGSVPVLFGITRRDDSAEAQLWVETYNAVIRGLAQRRQIPFVDLYAAIDPLEGHGLSSDGVHLGGFSGGACRLTAEGLMHGYNVRNLVALQVLDRAMGVMVDDLDAWDPTEPETEPLPGDGTAGAPYVLDGLSIGTPWAHVGDTTTAPSQIDAYPDCSDSDESGPELRYRLELDVDTPLRAIVLDGPGVDIDLHIVEAGGGGDACIARHDRMIQGVLPAGSWDLVLDTFVSGPDVFAGEYLLVLAHCADADEACAGQL